MFHFGQIYSMQADAYQRIYMMEWMDICQLHVGEYFADEEEQATEQI